jgi:RNA polymerase sigma-70 factor (ECF subfamily)
VFKRDPLADPEPLIRRVYAYVAYRIGDGPDAEDITNDTFERALRYRKSFDPSRGTPAAWLVGIAARCIADAARAPSVALDEREEGSVRFEDDAARRIELAGALAELSERDRELIALRYGADLTSKHIASLLDMKVNAVEVALHRALERMRTVLSGEEPVRAEREFVLADRVRPDVVT